jgi:hypothetical protein
MNFYQKMPFLQKDIDHHDYFQLNCHRYQNHYQNNMEIMFPLKIIENG